ncbi:hypothetical protein F2Q70_00027256 [Brassica cretica]|uniref:Uncharacterized protein n=1 Tax=Brassica cretica TaxID=69181 RepID=A0A8S9L9D1_BRACR|nr:hypothetical protein F2Q70_00027256 [Brassica cretica]KAF3575606.1 hypothetical protein DY000_02033419 [Brassica cretica]
MLESLDILETLVVAAVSVASVLLADLVACGAYRPYGVSARCSGCSGSSSTLVICASSDPLPFRYGGRLESVRRRCSSLSAVPRVDLTLVSSSRWTV